MKESKLIISFVFLSLFAFDTFGQDLSYTDTNLKEAIIYPNPVIGEKFTVKSEGLIKKVEVVNVIGKVINRTENDNAGVKEIQVFVGKCEKGIYFVKITYEDKKSIVKKLLIK